LAQDESVMFKLFAKVLVVSLIMLNIGWSVDACVFTSPEQVNTALLQNDTTSPDSLGAGLDCDDWCYAWVSHVALTRNDVEMISVSTAISVNSYTLSYSSLSIPPPHHPPIA
jgi:hypothetical protein